VSDPENDITGDEQAPKRLGPPVGADELMEQSRRRPPDLVGTRPEWDPDGLVPTETPRAASGRLWAPAGEGEEDDRETLGADGGAVATATAEAPADDAPVYAPHSARFQFLLGALLAVGAAAVALLVAVLIGGKDDGHTIALRNGPAWSQWKPAAPPGIDAAQEIAKHVGAEYRGPSGKQLVLVEGDGLQIAGLPVTIAIQQPAASGGDVDLIDDGVGVIYRLCAVSIAATSCRLPGTPSQGRALLLRREALELALYSFRYLGVSEAVVMLPPTTLQATDTKSITVQGTAADVPVPSTALLFRRGQPDVQAALNKPLTGTLSARTPTVSSVPRAPDSTAVRRITDPKAYASNFQPSNQDMSVYLVLTPLPIH
jgi:hypothetical protein